MGERHRAREIVLTCLYATRLSEQPAPLPEPGPAESSDFFQSTNQEFKGRIDPRQNLQAQLADQKFTSATRRFVTALLEKAITNSEKCDQLIKNHLKNWELKRIALMDRLIMHIAICEFLFFPDIPAAVTINEAVELAKKFSTADSGRFVNGILDPIAQSLKQNRDSWSTNDNDAEIDLQSSN